MSRWSMFSRSPPEPPEPDDWVLYLTDEELELLVSLTAPRPLGRSREELARPQVSLDDAIPGWAVPILRRLHTQARWRRRKVQRAAATAAAATTAASPTTAPDAVAFRDWLASAWPSATASLRASLRSIAVRLGVDLPKAQPPKTEPRMSRALRRTRSASTDAGDADRSPLSARHMPAASLKVRERKPASDEPRESDWTPVGGSRDSWRDRVRAALDDDRRHWH